MIKSHSLKLLTIGLPVELLLSFSVAADAQPKLKVTSATLPEQIILQENFIPPKEGKPKDTSGAGSRSQLKCSQKEGAIRPLMPKENYGLTLQERPTIFIQMPRTSARQVVLMFRDETGEFYERKLRGVRYNSKQLRKPSKRPNSLETNVLGIGWMPQKKTISTIQPLADTLQFYALTFQLLRR
jgi:hypothetical protein